MQPGISSEQKNRSAVLEANRRFYEAIAGVYEKVDQRRSAERDHGWLRAILKDLRLHCEAPNPVFLDLGAGTAFLAKLALEEFPRVIAADLSPAVLAHIDDVRIEKICAPCEKLPLEKESIAVVGAFATLHHLYEPEETFREAYRVLQHGGFFYSDHDIEKTFVSRFRWPLSIYRYFFDHGHEYLAHCPQLTATDYALTECHGETGLDGNALAEALRKIGFREVNIAYHWKGLLPLNPFWQARGFSPLLRIIAKK
ncbi:MAG: class I SAM-dependent methyltransferase [Bdellovibrionota bacterium]